MSRYSKEEYPNFQTVIDGLEMRRHEHVEGYCDLEFKYRSLEHEYGILENEFGLYSGETYEKINALEKEMDKIVHDKNKVIEMLNQENLILKNENMALKQDNFSANQKIEGLTVEINKLLNHISITEHNLKSQTLAFNQSESKHMELVLNYEKELHARISENESLKELLNMEKISNVTKDQIIITKDKEIGELSCELKVCRIDLEGTTNSEEEARELNYIMKKEVQELRGMFAEMEVQLKNCPKCQSLHLQNLELEAVIKGYMDRQKRESISIQKEQFSSTFTPQTEYKIPRKHSLNKHLTDISLSNVTVAPRESTPSRKLKDSVLRRCRFVIEHV